MINDDDLLVHRRRSSLDNADARSCPNLQIDHDLHNHKSKLDKANAQDFEKEREKVKLLLLGAGESGKSTLFKQMQILYGKGFDEAERRRFLPKIVGVFFSQFICIPSPP